MYSQNMQSHKLKSQWSEWLINPTDSAEKGMGKETLDSAFYRIFNGQSSGKKRKPPLAERKGNSVYLLLRA